MPSLLDCHIPEQAWLKEAGERNGTSTTPARLHGGNGDRREIPDAGRWGPVVVKIVEFQHLGDNWDGLNAVAPSRELLESAIGLAYLLSQMGMDPPIAVAPGLDGSVNFEWHAPDGTLCEIEIDRPFHAEVMLIEPGQPARHWTLPTE